MVERGRNFSRVHEGVLLTKLILVASSVYFLIGYRTTKPECFPVYITKPRNKDYQ